MSMPAPPAPAPNSAESYSCPYCRTTAPLTERATCRSCGAPAKLSELVSASGWVELPGAADMAEIQFGRSHLQVAGSFVPVADFRLDGAETIWFPPHKLTFAESGVSIGQHNDGNGFWTKAKAGMPRYLVNASGQGHIAISDNHPGEIVALPLNPNVGIWAKSHVFLAATTEIFYNPVQNGLWLRKRIQRGDDTEYETEYPLGYYDDVFFTQANPGLLLLHSPGNTMFRDLAPNETVFVKPDALLYRDLSVAPYLIVEYPRTPFSVWWSHQNRHTWLSLTGPGRVAISSKYEEEHEDLGTLVDGTFQTMSW